MAKKWTSQRAKSCADPACIRIANSSGYCDMHSVSAFATRAGHAKQFVEKAAHSQTDECIPWPFARDKDGYGQYEFTRAHREICTRVHGEPPTETHHAAHTCGRRSCVNPRHLYWKTPTENAADKVAHETNGIKLTNYDVQCIRHLLREGHSPNKIARQYRLTKGHVKQIGAGGSWFNLKISQPGA